MEKYFQGPKAKGVWMVNLSPWHFQFEMFQYETAINCSFFCFTTHHPSWRKPLAAATITPQIFVRCWWKLQHALVPGKKPCCYQKESSLGWAKQRCCEQRVVWVHQWAHSIFWKGRYEKCFTDSRIWGVVRKVIFFLSSSKIWFLFSPRSDSCVTFKMLWNQWQGVEFQLQTSQTFSWVERKYNELFISTLPLFIFGPSVLWGHPSENMFGCSII